MLSGVVSLFFFGQREDLPRRTVRQSVISPSPVEPPPPQQQPRPVVELEQPAEPRPSLTPATVSPTGQFEPRPAAATRTAGLTPSRSVAPAPAPTPVATPVAVDESSSPAESQPMEPTVSTVEAETEIDLPPPVEAGQLFDLDQVDVRPLARSRDLPRYPRRARRLGKQGRVTMRILIDHRGTVEQVELIEGIPGTDLTDAAIEAARGWRFSPAREAGQPVRVWRDVVLNFSLRDNGTTSVRIE
jgi:protein TonB